MPLLLYWKTAKTGLKIYLRENDQNLFKRIESPTEKEK